MKKLFLLCVVFLLFKASVSAVNLPQHYASTISDVTVYLQGAMIKRTARIKLEPGTSDIILDGLSNYLDINSVRLESGGNITILSVNASTNYLKPFEKSETEKKLQYSLDTSTLRQTRIKNEIAAYNTELEMLKQNYKVSATEKSAFVDALENSADFYQKRVKDILNQISDLNIRDMDYFLKITALNAQLNEINAKHQTPYGEITVTASSESSVEENFTFSYYVGNASWIPVYNMRAENTSTNVNLDYDAEVAQTTGEDWKNTKLILSTGNPSVNGVKPRMLVTRLDYGDLNEYQRRSYDNVMARGNRMNTDNTYYIHDKKIGEGYMTGRGLAKDKQVQDEMMKYASDYTSLNQNVLATTFEINLKYDILSDGIPKHVRIQQYALPAHFSYSCLPKICADAFLEANITGWEDYNLMPGEVNIFLENGFVGKSFIDPTTTKDTLAISFGKDKKINIRRVRVKDFTKKQFLGIYKLQSFGFATSIRNTKKMPVEIKVEDQIPVSMQKDIVVELLEGSGAQLDVLTGKLTWTITLQPNEEKTLKFEYTVKYPGKYPSGKFIMNL